MAPLAPRIKGAIVPDFTRLTDDLDRIAIRAAKLMVSHKDPEFFFVQSGKLVEELPW